MSNLSLLTVHAHPDDESSKGAASVALYHSLGVHTVLVSCTGGEEGDILNPAMDQPGVRENMHEIRSQELDDAARIIGYDEVVRLGYRDSGMPDSEANANPQSFAQAPLEEAVGRLVEVIRRVRPQVVVTYSKEQKGYPHPDHLKVNEITDIAFFDAADPEKYQGLGEPWQVSKLYYVNFSIKQMMATHDKFLELGLESPFDEERQKRFAVAMEEEKKRTTPLTSVDVSGFTQVRRDALRAHRTQIDPESPWWFGLPDTVAAEVYPFDDYLLEENLTESDPTTETDLFSGVAELRPTAGVNQAD